MLPVNIAWVVPWVLLNLLSPLFYQTTTATSHLPPGLRSDT